MKRFSLCFAVALVLFSFQGGFAKPTKSQLDSLEALFAPPETSKDTIYYDFVGKDTIPAEPFFDLTTQPRTTNYWIAQKFTPDNAAFTLKVIYFQVDNTQSNTVTGCNIRVTKDNPQTQPSSPDTNNIQWQMFVPPTLSSRLRSIRLSDATAQPESLSYGPNQNFWIMLGPVPGGVHPDTANLGDGWWAAEKRSPYLARNYIRDVGDSVWNPRGANSNWVLRAGGYYGAPPDPVINEVMFNADRTSSDFVRNHEWVELYNPAPSSTIRQAQGWVLTNGQGPFFPSKSYTLPNLSFYGHSYLVVHFATGVNDTDLSDGRGDVYTGNSAEFFGDLIDACVLRTSDVTPKTFDIVAWNLKNLSTDPDSTAKTNREDASFNSLNKVTRLRPIGGVGPLLTVNKGVSIGRDRNGSNPSTSTNGQNLALLGGKDAAGPTMGKGNFLPMVVDNSNIRDTAVSNADWTVMLYFAADYGAGADSPERWCYDILNQVESQLPPNLNNSKANVLVWFDSRRVYPKDAIADSGTVFRGVLRHDLSDTVRNLVPIGEKNSGDSASLRSFITWARDSFPANRYVLALKGDGAGWEGLCEDIKTGGVKSSDRLDMSDLKEALGMGLGANKLELLIFDASLMSQLEVAVQVSGFARSMVASPEMIGPADFDYSRLAGRLGGGSLAVVTSDSLAKNAVGGILEKRKTPGDLFWTWVALRLDPDSLGLLLDTLGQLASNLKTGIEDPCRIDSAADNFQLFVRKQLKESDHYGDQAQGMADFVDLKDLSNRLSNSYSSFCSIGHQAGAQGVYRLLGAPGEFGFRSAVILAQSPLDSATNRGKHLGSGSAGLSIYFPSSRQKLTPISSTKKSRVAVYDPIKSEHPFDTPGLFTEGGVFDTLRMYARDTSVCYPHAPGTCTGDTMAWYYPLPVVRDFNFVNRTLWDEFLIRYYKPVADAGPEQINGSLNVPVTLDASGSSDADDEPSSLQYFWDLFSLVEGPFGCDSTKKEDLDKNCVDDATDDADTMLTPSQTSFQYSFQNSGKQAVWLHVWDDYDGTLSGTNRGYHTAKDSSVVAIAFQGVHLVLETTLVSGVYNAYNSSLARLGITDRCNTPLPIAFDRNNISSTRLSGNASTCPTAIWTTSAESTVTFPSACQAALGDALNTDNMSVWICAPLLGKDTTAAKYFNNKLSSGDNLTGDLIKIDSVRTSAKFLQPANGPHFLSGLPHLELLDTVLGIPLQSLNHQGSDSCPTFPILVTNNGKTVAVARVLVPRRHAIIYSTFSLEQLADTLDRDLLMRGILGWLASPEATNICPCANQKGDMDGSGGFSANDVVLMLSCVFQGTGNCALCFADVDCSGGLSPTDVTLELNRVFSGSCVSPWCGPQCGP